VIGSTTPFGDTLTSLADNDGVPEVTSSAASDDDVLLLAPSSDVHDIAVIVQLTHGNIIALWTQLRYEPYTVPQKNLRPHNLLTHVTSV